MSEERNSDDGQSPDRGYGGAAGSSRPPRDGGKDDRPAERAQDLSQLSRRERVNLARSARASADRRIEQRLTVLPVRQPAHERRLDTQVGEPTLLGTSLKRRARSNGVFISFVIAVVLPVLLATGYFGWFASNQYVVEFRFAVSDTSPTPSAAAMSSSIMSMISGGSSGSATLENYMVADYLTSRQAIEELERRIKVKELYSRPEADWWARFDPSEPMEKFVPYWQKMVTANYDMITGLAVAQVRAFTADDAYQIGNSLVQLSEELINRIANRANIDAVRFAEREVERLQERLKAIRVNVTEYRNRVGVIDPTTSVVAGNSTVQTTLQTNLASLETQLTSLLGRHLLPTSPAVQTLQNQIKATKDQLAAIESTVGSGKDRAGGAALSKVVSEYEQLAMEQTFAQTMVTGAMAALDQARANAAAQHIYITPYVRPSLPESSTYPRRAFSVLVSGLVAFAAWLIGLLIFRSIRERFG